MMDAELRACLRIDAPEWYRRQDFRDFLNGKRDGQEGRSPAMWHRRGEEPDEMSDVFVTFDTGEGSDAEGIIPDDIWEAICAIAEKHGFEDGIVWISNVGHDRPVTNDEADALATRPGTT